MAIAAVASAVNPQIAAREQQNKSFLPLAIKPGAPPFLKQQNRREYIDEYVGYYKDGAKFSIKAIALFGLGLATLEIFPPGALFMIALSARYQDIAWMDRFIYKTFGKYRSLTLID
ncbi:hypothetical protein COU36_04980 [Candidatus Micrarchaeota archaeon CG10_big_fil_rev_8_21_14_0_10_59_7]|nr:MAG: hypothetical protein COU36_04980 [Candidatus Micrarchaeota archaeon CG10_big_fil_rev_8_21_14_0_10_59_7]